ncbi:hypothetical protein MWU38_03720 [Qipengyuania sp. S6317L1]|uniref:hypothetical protein n=1 Tax=Qipengyuania sp. S6317L1 TaxID=2926410 RepID=UPI001FF52761|nr:hypothetical protein [Qipengyuania sp. S6317L1]MCK0098484.1 hypothetical protein [Qipengyuania sp. S6317L1]
MYTKAFFQTKLGQASLASIVATTAMVALTTQMNMVAADSHFAQPHIASPISVELA